MKELVTWFE